MADKIVFDCSTGQCQTVPETPGDTANHQTCATQFQAQQAAVANLKAAQQQTRQTLINNIQNATALPDMAAAIIAYLKGLS